MAEVNARRTQRHERRAHEQVGTARAEGAGVEVEGEDLPHGGGVDILVARAG